MSKDTYCSHPFYNIHIQGNKKTPCCLMYNGGVEGTIEQAWSSDHFESIRQAFRSNQKHPACNTCWNEESIHGRSQRRAFTLKQNRFGNAPTMSAPNIKTISWSFSNTCNFACRTCSLELSTGWLRETKLLAEQGDSQAARNLERHVKTQWDDTQWQQIEPMLPEIVYFDIIGGEPLINPRLPQMLDRIIDSGHAQHINLMITTNGSTGPTAQWVERLKQFKSLLLNFSIDAVTEDTFKYVRTGDWQQVSDNIDQWKRQDWVDEMRCNATFSILNIWDCDRILHWLDRKFGVMNVGYNWVEVPKYYNAVNLPEQAKQHIQKKSTYWHSKKVLPQMWSSQGNEKQWTEFVRRTEWLDQSRDEPMQKYMPSLFEIINTFSIHKEHNDRIKF